MSGLKIGLVASSSDESAQLAALLEKSGAELTHNIQPEDISSEQINDQNLHVWLLSVDDDSWHDAIDHLLDESEVPVYFSEPGTLAKQSHPEFWCSNLLARLYEITGLERDSEGDSTPPQSAPESAVSNTVATPSTTATSNQNEVESAEIESAQALQDEEQSVADTTEKTQEEDELHTPLGKSLQDLELSTVGLPSDIAAELVSELESISPVLRDDDVESDEFAESDDTADIEMDWEEPSHDFDDLADGDETALDDASFDETNFDESLSLEIDSELSLDLDEETADDDISLASVQLDVTDDSFDLDTDTDTELTFELPDDSELEYDIGLSETEPEFKIESEIDTETQAESELESESEALSIDLELAPTEEETKPKITGRAQYQIDESDESIAAQTNEKTGSKTPVKSDEPEEGGLSLAPVDDVKPIKGRANYKIDEGDEPPVKTPPKPVTAQQPVEEKDTSGLSLQAIETENEPEWLREKNASAKNSASTTQSDPLENEDIILRSASDDDLNDSRGDQSVESSPAQDEFELSNDEDDDEFAFSLEQMEIEGEATEDELLTDSIDDEPAFELDSVISESNMQDEDSLPIDSLDFEESVPEAEFELVIDEDEPSVAVDTFVLDQAVTTDEEIGQSSVMQDDSQTLLDAELSAGLELNDDAIREIAREALDENENSAGTESPPESLDFEIPMLDETAGDVEFEEKIVTKNSPRFTQCWIIGASLGGPAAVKRFLNCLPADIDAAFVIAQHIDENFLPVLAEILTNSSQFKVTVAQGSNEIKPGKVYLAPLKGKLIFLQDGSMLVDHSQKWSGPYSPCINDVIESVCQVYRERCGAIIFSGMGEDGVSGATKMRKLGGQVWAQSTETCANPTMPEAVINSGETDFVGTPEALAERLIRELKGSLSRHG